MLVSVTLTKQENQDENIVTVKPLSTIARVDSPKIFAKNWYSSNFQGTMLKYIITINGNYSVLQQYDKISFMLDGTERVYTILNSTEISRYSTRMEVGV
jgi:hypothetical protein